MTTNSLSTKLETDIRFTTVHGEVAMNIALVKSNFCPKATPVEAYTFIRFCQSAALNPFLGEAYLIKYQDNQPANIVIGKNVYTQRAELSPDLDYWTAGVIVSNKESGEIKEYQGTFIHPGDELVGGWCECKRKDVSQPFVAKVALSEYNSNQAQWKQRPSTMIRKVAIVQCLREAFPVALTGLYDDAEMSGRIVDQETGEIVGMVEPVAVSAPPKPEDDRKEIDDLLDEAQEEIDAKKEMEEAAVNGGTKPLI